MITRDTYKSLPLNIKDGLWLSLERPKSKVGKYFWRSSGSTEQAVQNAFLENKTIFHKKSIKMWWKAS